MRSQIEQAIRAERIERFEQSLKHTDRDEYRDYLAEKRNVQLQLYDQRNEVTGY